MTEPTRAADLPEGSVVLDDRRGIVWYAIGDPAGKDRWDATGTEVTSNDGAIDWALRHGAVILRVGEGSP